MSHTPLHEILHQLDGYPAMESRLVIDMAELDLERGADAVLLVDRIKHFLELGGQLEIHRAPQLLAHNLYRVGLLTHIYLTLIQTRMDEAHAG